MTAPATAPRRPSSSRRARTGVDRSRPQAVAPDVADEVEPMLFDERCARPGGAPTLEELVGGVWEALAAHQRVPCPLCGGEMVPGYGAHARTVAGRCEDCGTTLS